MNRMVLGAVSIDGELQSFKDFDINDYKHHNGDTVPDFMFTHGSWSIDIASTILAWEWDDLVAS